MLTVNSLVLSVEVPAAVGQESPLIFLAAQDLIVVVPDEDSIKICPGPTVPLAIIAADSLLTEIFIISV